MNTTKIKVVDLQTLQLEKQWLRMMISYTENEINSRFRETAINYKSMLLQSAISFAIDILKKK